MSGNPVKWYPSISDKPTMEDLVQHIRLLYNAVNDHDQAITTLNGKVTTTTTTPTTGSTK